MIEKYIVAYREWLIMKNYAEYTIRAYTYSVIKFYNWCADCAKKKDWDKSQAIKKYLVHRFDKEQKKWQTINGDYSALRLFWKHILKREWKHEELPRPRKEQYIPDIPSVEEVQHLIAQAKNVKDRAFMLLLYSTGIRLGEALHLEIKNIDAGQKRIRIEKGKGAKTRYVPMPDMLLEELRIYYKQYRPYQYLFNGKVLGKTWNDTRVQQFMKLAAKQAKITKRISPHILRHAFATHSLKLGLDLVSLQKILGHKYIKTTLGYIHLAELPVTSATNPIYQIKPLEREQTKSNN